MDDKILKPQEHYLKIYFHSKNEKEESMAYNIYHDTCFSKSDNGSKLECIYEDDTRLFSFNYYGCPFEVETIWKQTFGEDNIRIWDNYLDVYDCNLQQVRYT
jgi:hypothetical protein